MATSLPGGVRMKLQHDIQPRTENDITTDKKIARRKLSLLELADEQAILDHCLAHPCHGALRVANELALAGIQVSSTGVRGVWSRHGLLSRHDRLLRLEKASAEHTFTLSEEQIEALEHLSPEVRERHIEAHHTGDLVAVDTFFVGHLKGVGKVYLQSAIDCCSRYGWGRFYTNKMPVTAVHLLNTDVLPTFEAHGIEVNTVLSDNGREF